MTNNTSKKHKSTKVKLKKPLVVSVIDEWDNIVDVVRAYSRNVNLSELKKHYNEKFLNQTFFNKQKKINIKCTKDSYNETFRGYRNGQLVKFTYQLATGIHYLSYLLENGIFIEKHPVPENKIKQNKLKAKEILIFDSKLKIEGDKYTFRIPILKIKNGTNIQYSIKIK